jgi:hypothetical protein
MTRSCEGNAERSPRLATRLDRSSTASSGPEFLDGAHLLYLLKEHADLDARIEVPEDLIDPSPDVALS